MISITYKVLRDNKPENSKSDFNFMMFKVRSLLKKFNYLVRMTNFGLQIQCFISLNASCIMEHYVFFYS